MKLIYSRSLSKDWLLGETAPQIKRLDLREDLGGVKEDNIKESCRFRSRKQSCVAVDWLRKSVSRVQSSEWVSG